VTENDTQMERTLDAHGPGNAVNLTVVGGGFMGSQIAVQAALHGISTRLVDLSSAQLAESRRLNTGHLQRRVDKGRMSADEMAATLSRVHDSTELAAGLADAEVVIEAIVENVEAKRALFTELDRLAPANAVLASNSSTIVISKLADATQRPDRCISMHFFSPVLVMELCEVVKGPETSDTTADKCMKLVRAMGRIPILVQAEIEGFIVNRIQLAATQEAHRLFEQGVASLEDIDTAVEKGLNWPLGPFRLNDLTGLDVTYAARKHIYEATADERYKPTKALEDRVKAGHLGRKTGQGWYKHPEHRP
jgi:3-hydroxybutyryl-CoA dehydrogenase